MSNQPRKLVELELNFLRAEEIGRIDAALAEVGDFGEVRLIKAKGKLRFIQKLQSEEIEGRRRNGSE